MPPAPSNRKTMPSVPATRVRPSGPCESTAPGWRNSAPARRLLSPTGTAASSSTRAAAPRSPVSPPAPISYQGRCAPPPSAASAPPPATAMATSAAPARPARACRYRGKTPSSFPRRRISPRTAFAGDRPRRLPPGSAAPPAATRSASALPAPQPARSGREQEPAQVCLIDIAPVPASTPPRTPDCTAPRASGGLDAAAAVAIAALGEPFPPPARAVFAACRSSCQARLAPKSSGLLGCPG